MVLTVHLYHVMVDVVLESFERARRRVVPVKSAEVRRLEEPGALASQMFVMVTMGEDVVGARKGSSRGLTVDLTQLVDIGEFLELNCVGRGAWRGFVGNQAEHLRQRRRRRGILYDHWRSQVVTRAKSKVSIAARTSSVSGTTFLSVIRVAQCSSQCAMRWGPSIEGLRIRSRSESDETARCDEHVSHRQGPVRSLDVVMEKLAELGYGLTRSELATPSFAFALVEVPRAFMTALAQKANYVAAFVVRRPDPLYANVSPRFPLDPELDELFKLAIVDLL